MTDAEKNPLPAVDDSEQPRPAETLIEEDDTATTHGRAVEETAARVARNRLAVAVAVMLFILCFVFDPFLLFRSRSPQQQLHDVPSAPTAVDQNDNGVVATEPPLQIRDMERKILAGALEALPRGVSLRAIDVTAALRNMTAPRISDIPVRRRWNASAVGSRRPRVLLTDAFASKYGLTNILMTMSAMIAYGSADDRVVHFPTRSPVLAEQLLDLAATEELLRPANVVLLTDADYQTYYGTERITRARKLGISLGYRNLIGSSDLATAQRALEFQRGGMQKSRKILVLQHRDFFLSFPFRATSPLDLCFYIKRFVFHLRVRQMAAALLRGLQMKSPSPRASFMAFHLRLEGDVKLLRKQAVLITPARLTAFINDRIIPLANAARIKTVYVCAGALPAVFLHVLQNASRRSGVTFFTKIDFRDIGVPMVDENVTVTDHIGAAVDAILLREAAVAVTFFPSTYTTNAVASRCPSPARGTTRDAVTDALKVLTLDGTGLSSLVEPSPRDAIPAADCVPPVADPPPPFEGVVTYDFTEDGDFTRLSYVACSDRFTWCRF